MPIPKTGIFVKYKQIQTKQNFNTALIVEKIPSIPLDSFTKGMLYFYDRNGSLH